MRRNGGQPSLAAVAAMRAGPGRDSISGEWVPQVSSVTGVTGAGNGAFGNGSRHDTGGAAYSAAVHRKSASASTRAATCAAAATEQQGPHPLFGGPLRSVDSGVMASGDIGSALANAGGTPLGGGGAEASHRGDVGAAAAEPQADHAAAEPTSSREAPAAAAAAAARPPAAGPAAAAPPRLHRASTGSALSLGRGSRVPGQPP